MRVLSAAGQNLPERHIGELAIQSDTMLTGYYNRPDLDPWQEGWFRTGDMGYIADGEIYIVGRAKDLIINAGKNIYPQDIEAIVNEVAGVHPGRVVVFGVPDEREGTELVAVVAELTAEGQANPTAMQRAIRQAVAQQAQVTASYVHLVDERWLIKTSSGKLGRAANRAKWEGERTGD
ncbi:MAG: AMP-binding protein [Chloroflexi bacterium]|nr:AMP-binding protein [Chloroflexota bacterium]